MKVSVFCVVRKELFDHETCFIDGIHETFAAPFNIADTTLYQTLWEMSSTLFGNYLKLIITERDFS